ncbi:MAG: hypothetical protein ACRCY9_16795, partial [Phycicoccus sp.]
MAVLDDSGGRGPTVPDDAGPVERQLFGVHEFDTWAAFLGSNDWGRTADGVRDLALDVRRVVGRLTAADEPWTGPAAEAAFASLRTLATSLEDRAAEFGRIQTGLDRAREAAIDARVSYHREVQSVSTAVDRADFERQVPRSPGGGPAPDGVAFDAAGFDRAVAGRQAEREAAATRVLDAFTAQIGEAADAMPVDAPPDAVVVDRAAGVGGGAGGVAGGGGAGRGVSQYAAPSGDGGVTSGTSSSGGTQVGAGVGGGVGGAVVPGGSGEVVVDGPATGGGLTPVGPDPATGPGPAASSPVGGGTAGAGLGGIGSSPAGAAVGVGGLAAGGAAGLVGRAGWTSAGGLAGRPSLVVGTPSAASGGARASGASRGAAGVAGRSGVVPVGGQAGAAGGARASGASRGAAGVAGRSGVVPVGGQAGAAGGARSSGASRGAAGVAGRSGVVPVGGPA